MPCFTHVSPSSLGQQKILSWMLWQGFPRHAEELGVLRCSIPRRQVPYGACLDWLLPKMPSRLKKIPGISGKSLAFVRDVDLNFESKGGEELM